MSYFISGSSGLIGKALQESLETDGYKVVCLPRVIDGIDFSGANVIINLAGESIAEGRWTAAKKKKIVESRIEGTKRLTTMLSKSENTTATFISASAIGYYGNRYLESLDEASSCGTGFLSKLCVDWENAALPAKKSGIRTIMLRTGMVLSLHGGILKKILPQFRLGFGGKLGSGRQYMSWIGLDDMVAAIRFVIENKSMEGPVNMVAPNPVTNQEFIKTLGTVINRPTIMPFPAVAVRLLFGQMADELLLSSLNVVPMKLISAGFKFKHPTLKSALENILK